MIPMRTSTIFKSRWMALLWAAGIIWFAYDFAAPSSDGNGANAEQPTDVTGATITDEDAKKFEQAVNTL
jgi:hypothetical protein